MLPYQKKEKKVRRGGGNEEKSCAWIWCIKYPEGGERKLKERKGERRRKCERWRERERRGVQVKEMMDFEEGIRDTFVTIVRGETRERWRQEDGKNEKKRKGRRDEKKRKGRRNEKTRWTKRSWKRTKNSQTSQVIRSRFILILLHFRL